MHLKYPACIYEKGWRSRHHEAKRRLDLRLSVLGQLAVAMLIQVAAAATFHGSTVQINSLEDLTRLYSEILGPPGRILFGVGMWTAVFTNFICNNTAYGLLGADFYERFIRQDSDDAREETDARRRVFRLVVALFCILPLYVLFTSWKPIWLTIIASAMFVFITPVANLGLLVITSDRSIMKDRVNGIWSRVVISGWLAVALFLSYKNASELILGGG
jgi:manganese transport protein